MNEQNDQAEIRNVAPLAAGKAGQSLREATTDSECGYVACQKRKLILD